MLHKVDTHNIPELTGIIEQHLTGSKVLHRTSVEYFSAAMVISSQAGNGSVWVDDLKNPTCYIYVTTNRRSILDEVAGLVEAVYVAPSCTNKLKTVKEMIKTAETFFRYHKCKVANVSSWIADGNKDVVKIWQRMGYVPQEIVTLKYL